MDWVGDAPPTASALAGRSVLDQGHAHIKTIVHTGGHVLGCRYLDEDGLVAEPTQSRRGAFTFITRLAERAFSRM